MTDIVTSEFAAAVAVVGFWGWVFCAVQVLVRCSARGTVISQKILMFAVGFFLAYGMWIGGMLLA